VPIYVERFELWDEPLAPSTTRDVRGATVEQLLVRLRVTIPFSNPLTCIVQTDGSIRCEDTVRSERTVAGVHHIDPILATSEKPWLVLGWDWQRRSREDVIPDRLRMITRHLVTPGFPRLTPLPSDPVVRFGDRWIVITTPQNHWLIDQIVREEVEARRAKKAVVLSSH
jgi:hypothetical protein